MSQGHNSKRIKKSGAKTKQYIVILICRHVTAMASASFFHGADASGWQMFVQLLASKKTAMLLSSHQLPTFRSKAAARSRRRYNSSTYDANPFVDLFVENYSTISFGSIHTLCFWLQLFQESRVERAELRPTGA